MDRVSYSHRFRRVRVSSSERIAFDLPRRGPLADGAGNTGNLNEDEFEAEDAWVEADIDERWRAAFRLVESEGRTVVGEVRLFPCDEFPERKHGEWRAEVVGLLAGHLGGERPSGKGKHWRGGENAYFSPLGDGISASLIRKIPFSEHVRFAGAAPHTASHRESRKPRKRRGKGAWPERDYAELAEKYAARLRAGSRKPLRDLAREGKLSYEQVRDAIHTARDLGLLTPSKQGRPGGNLTPRAFELLRAEDRQSAKRRRARGKKK